MNIILSSGKVGHYYNLALCLQNAGYLKKFITTAYFKGLDRESAQNRLLISASGGRVFSRFHSHLSDSLVTTIFYPEAISRLLKMLPYLHRGLATKVFNDLFDLASCRHVEHCDIYMAAISYGLFSARKARALGAKIILDLISAHPCFYIPLLKEEAAKYGVELVLKDEYYLRKMIEEIQLADYVFVPSRFVARTAIAQGVESNKIRLLPYGVDISRFCPSHKSDDVFRILYVGTLSFGKGIQYLLPAFQELNLPHSELLLIGQQSPEITKLLAKYLGVHRHIPVVPHQFLKTYYNESSIFILPSLVEGSALVVYEAMACGLPVIVTENCGSVVRDSIDGFIVPIRDVDALKEKILFLFENEDIREEMGRNARIQAQRFSWSTYQENIIKAFDDIYLGRELFL